jgi:hypothetical protein
VILGRSLAVHGGLLVIAGALALRAYTSTDEGAEQRLKSYVWEGGGDAVTLVRFEHPLGEMTIEPRKDTEGRYFIGTVVKETPAAPPSAEPAPVPATVDGGGADETPAAAPTPPSEKSTARFIAVKEGQELFSRLAPLEALRVLGKVDPSREADFGFDAVQGSLYVSISGKDHTLVFGGTTPGGSDHYVRDPATGRAYVVPGAILRDLTSADQRLVERDLHAFDESTVRRVKLKRGEAVRELVRHAEKKGFWAGPDTPDEKDETASNWMDKLGKLRVTSYAGDSPVPPVTPADVVIEVEYFDDRRKIGFLELVRRPGDGDRPEYIARTEHSRWYAGVLRSTGEQIDQDVQSVVSP